MRRILPLVLVSIAFHSLLLGAVLLTRPLLVLERLGWDFEGTRFFPAQSGLFLLILGVFYAAALWHRPYLWVIVVSKAFAVAFLLTEAIRGSCPSILYLAAAGDALMGVAAVLVWWLERRRSA